jgi:GNAT superfamily N-acetyltransferase
MTLSRASRALSPKRQKKAPAPVRALRIRGVQAADIRLVIALDKLVTGLAKPRYWQDVFEEYGRRRAKGRFFLVAEPTARAAETQILGFIIGEVRAWEFGSAPCGWVFALSVEPNARLGGVGEELFAEISAEFKRAGVTKMRTMVARDNPLPMVFFRAEGMVAGPYIQLEKELD